MGKTAKNFSLQMRRSRAGGNSRVSMRKLRDSDAEEEGEEGGASSSGMEEEREQKQQQHNNAKFSVVSSRTVVEPDWTLSTSAALKLLFSIRLSASLWSVMSDCDEVYNYWEPLHLVLFGRGFQTWEYAPQYAIRSWLYVLLYAIPAQPFLWLVGPNSKPMLFFILRFLIGCLCLLAEFVLYKSVCKRAGNGVGRAFLLFSLGSPAMFGASCAFLPSAFSMALNALSMAFYLQEKWFLSIFLVASSALLGWPFAALLGLPVLFHCLGVRPRQLGPKCIVYSAISGTALLAALAAVDSHFFGKFVIAPLNIVLYNIFSKHGPNLYGTEPVMFYVKNLLLNFNLALPLSIVGLCCLLITFLVQLFPGALKEGGGSRRSSSSTTVPLPFALISVAALLWLAVFFAQPHKEERFLFPVYPHICLLAAFGLDFICRRLRAHYRLSSTLCCLLAALFLALSASRVWALHRNYAGLLDPYRALNEHLLMDNDNATTGMETEDDHQQQQVQQRRIIRLCVGKEWHRFPSSFFLPDNVVLSMNGSSSRSTTTAGAAMVELRFVRSEFAGILPKPFGDNAAASDDADASLAGMTRRVPHQMNDVNLEQPDRYVPVHSCHFLVDMDTGRETGLEPNYAGMPMFRSIAQRQVLLPAESHPIFRAFYLPFTHSALKFGTMHLLQRRRRHENGL